MGKYVAVAMMIAVATGPAAALDIGGGGKIGGVGVGAGVGAGSQGVSAGVGASVGGAGGASVGASAGTGGVSVGASVSAGGTSVGASANADTGSVGAGVSVGSASPGGVSAGVSTGTATSGTTDAAPPDDPAVFFAKSAKTAVSLPSVLKPSRTGGGGRFATGYPFAPLLKAMPGTPTNVVSACRAAIVAAARPLGAVRVYAVSAGPMRQRKAGQAAPIEVRINYALPGGIQVRQAKVICHLDATRKVIAVT
ncbi:hypothetical protein EOA23_22130 [Mesorhizobium sp. M2A.F.Ca.ET.042.01.1.1]|uniref:hypothetical protein n=1 Tax=Mesorhizobium sp. M2A.F.Ca.ET.042.01.1.1 TaxID=2496745 RepID=UPI000FCC3937|nr:hypothetical protein [Mesorhizobium sp. M2A.F.Ca.ET.042.01.1.1]RUX24402.1 hypothetical protein EOA23_22130 [Mesorhizobium sp. M2A.F.Ca.ET.042.01.1.1]